MTQEVRVHSTTLTLAAVIYYCVRYARLSCGVRILGSPVTNFD